MSKNARIRLEQIEKARKLLQELPEKEEVKTREEAIGILGKDFRIVAQKGYSPQEISILLKEADMFIPVTALKNSMRLKERKKRTVKAKNTAENISQNEIKNEAKNGAKNGVKKSTDNDAFIVPDTPLDEL